MSAYRRSTLACCLLAAITASSALAEGGALRGKVSDSSGAPIAKVTVTLSGVGFDFERVERTNKKGDFSFTVPDAERKYTIRMEKEGYAAFEQPFELEAGQTIGGEWVLATEQEAAAASGKLLELEAMDQATQAYNRGVEAFNAGNDEDAIAAFREALELNAELELGYASLTRILLLGKRWAEAREVAEAHLALKPEEPLALQSLYDSHWGEGNKEEADKVLERLLAVDTGGAVAARIFNQAVAATKAADYEAATQGFEKAYQLDPKLHQALLPLAQIHFSKEEWQPAIDKAEAYLEHDKANPRANIVRYRSYQALGDQDAAERAFADIEAHSPKAASESFLRDGINDFNDGMVARSIENVQTAVALDPTNAQAHYQLGLCYASAQRNDQARASFEKFLEMAPDHPEAAMAKEMLSALN